MPAKVANVLQHNADSRPVKRCLPQRNRRPWSGRRWSATRPVAAAV